MTKNKIIIIFLVISIIAFLIYYLNLPPSDIEEKGGEGITALISLITAIVSLLTSIVTLITKWLEVRQGKNGG